MPADVVSVLRGEVPPIYHLIAVHADRFQGHVVVAHGSAERQAVATRANAYAALCRRALPGRPQLPASAAQARGS